MKKLLILPIILLCSITLCRAQQNTSDTAIKYDVLSFALGAGFDYGGIGINATIYPHKNIGIFGGVGYAIAGVGYNVGLKFRFPGKGKFTPFILGMYGYNAAIHVKNEDVFGPNNMDKIFYGPTAGVGFDLGVPRAGKTTFSVALMVPFRSPDVDAYMTNLENQGVTFKNKLPPIGVSIGFTLAQL